LGDYNLISPDTKKNRFIESLEILKSLKVPPKEEGTTDNLHKRLVIVFNKVDVFKRKIEEKINLDSCFEDYKGEFYFKFNI
jgi:hypothetical protein